ncbi:hypothetical protein ACHWQZ_G001093 [Mnemiopsis leidyi]
MYAKHRSSSDLMAIGSSYNRHAALLFDNAYKKPVGYSRDQPTSTDQAPEEATSGKDSRKTTSTYCTSSGEKFTGLYPAPPVDPSSLKNIMAELVANTIDTVAGIHTLEVERENRSAAAGTSWRNLVVKSRALNTDSGTTTSRLGNLVDLVRQSQYFGAQNNPNTEDSEPASADEQAQKIAEYKVRIQALEIQVKSMEEANQRETIDSGNRWRLILKDKEAQFNKLRAQVRELKEIKNIGDLSTTSYLTSTRNGSETENNTTQQSSSEIDFSDPWACQLEIGRLVRENHKLLLRLRELELSSKMFFMSHVIVVLIAVLLL